MVPLSCSSSLIINLCHVCTGGRFPLKLFSRTAVVVLYDSIMSLPQKAKLLQKGSRARDSCASIIQSCVPWMDKINMKSLRWASLSFRFKKKKKKNRRVSGTFSATWMLVSLLNSDLKCIDSHCCHYWRGELTGGSRRHAETMFLLEAKDVVTGFIHQIRNFLSRLE